jgi:copper chaperone CopZ
MKNTYTVSGMTCIGCQAKVQNLLSTVTGVKNVSINLSKAEAVIEMDKFILAEDLKTALRAYPKYQLTEHLHPKQNSTYSPQQEGFLSWISTYKPILIIFGYITSISLFLEYMQVRFIMTHWMGNFMAGFFLVFSFFKFLDLKGFAESYSTYDIIAKKWKYWGYIYAFTELTLGVAFLSGFNPILTNVATFVVMSESIIGVLQSVIHKRGIKCACLGTVFNLPMSTITIIEDTLMIVMSAAMIYNFI